MLLPCFNRLSNVGAPPATILGKRRSAKHQASADSFSTGGAKGRSVRTQSGENSNHKSEWKPNGFNATLWGLVPPGTAAKTRPIQAAEKPRWFSTMFGNTCMLALSISIIPRLASRGTISGGRKSMQFLFHLRPFAVHHVGSPGAVQESCYGKHNLPGC